MLSDGLSVGGNSLGDLPDEVLARIMQSLDLNTRLKCCFVCKKWQVLMTSQVPNFCVPDVAVLNVFESEVWEFKLAKAAKSKVNSMKLKDTAALSRLISHIGQCNSVKLWFKSDSFVCQILRLLNERQFKIRCLDLYPFNSTLPLQHASNFFPNLDALIIRPHGPDFFWSGMPLKVFPSDFLKLDTLIADSINMGETVALPDTLTQLEWSHREDGALALFLQKLKTCHKLNYLSISHAQLDDQLQSSFLEILQDLPEIMIISFKFVRFCNMSLLKTLLNAHALKELRILKFDLCYGDLGVVFEYFLKNQTSCTEKCASNDKKGLQILNVNTIFEENQLNAIFDVVWTLAKRNIWLQLGVLQRQSAKLKSKVENVATAAERVGPYDAQNIGPNEVQEINAQHQNEEEILQQPAFAMPPVELRQVLCKLELSFLEDEQFLLALLSCGIYDHLFEAKFVQCPALNDENLQILAKCCPRLKKLQITDCASVVDEWECLTKFFDCWTDRKSRHLQIIWRLVKLTDLEALRQKIAEKFDDLPDSNYPLKLRVKHYVKNLPGYNCAIDNKPSLSNKNFRLVVYDDFGKLLTIQDYLPTELNAIFGLVASNEKIEDEMSKMGGNLESLTLDVCEK